MWRAARFFIYSYTVFDVTYVKIASAAWFFYLIYFTYYWKICSSCYDNCSYYTSHIFFFHFFFFFPQDVFYFRDFLNGERLYIFFPDSYFFISVFSDQQRFESRGGKKYIISCYFDKVKTYFCKKNVKNGICVIK